MLADLLLPPGFSATITLSGEHPPLNATVAVMHGEAWVGEITATASLLDQPGKLQEVVDSLTRRGVRA